MPPDFEAIAHAVKQVESSGGTNVGPRYEPVFQRRYLQGKPQWEALAKRYGWKAVSSSYGPWQIMYPVAVELGFTGSPAELADPAINRQYFDKKFQRDYQATRGDLQKTLLRYNGGGDPTYPQRVLQFLKPRSHVPPTHPGGRMATLDEMRLEGPEVHEQITKQLYRMETNLKAMGLGAMTPEQLRRSYERIKQGIVAVVQSQKRAALGGSGQVPPSPAAPPPMPASSNPPPPVPGTDLPVSTFAEAGFINDASGQATEQGRNRLGIR